MELTLTDRIYFSAQEKTHPEFILNERIRIARDRYYFANLRNEIYKRAIPSYVLLKEGALQTIYPERVVKAIHEIDEMERLHFLGDKFLKYAEECEREKAIEESLLKYMIMEAKDCKCCMCDKQAVAFYPCVDPDIPSHPYCADHLEESMVDMAKAVWKDDKGMQAVAIYQAKQTANKYR